MWTADGSSLVPRARIVECDRAKPSDDLQAALKTPPREVLAHVCPGLRGHFIVDIVGVIDAVDDQGSISFVSIDASRRGTQSSAG